MGPRGGGEGVRKEGGGKGEGVTRKGGGGDEERRG